ncbi:hypothetical protein FBY03_101447 [Pseudomonas sp. SJZ079]|uniref:hypothetical protein n=1 Tax=Pseudomonas sp. SJZ079 TaxID=2572887 RepID=UPI00119BE03F|nr:hypothetical protein [Pseudomonas sp. SJZ079]TWC43251.1 hypothetical protein FBY03_101447 [Pseudomonas sp. SJZ079]
MLNGVSASSTALTAYSSNPNLSGPADLRAYLDFQILLSRVLTQEPPSTAPDNAAEPQASETAALASPEADLDFQQFIAQRQFELSVSLNQRPEKVDRLTLVLLADAISAGSRAHSIEPELTRYPLSLL